MKIYAYARPKFVTSFVVNLLTEDGFLLDCFECFSYKRAPEFAQSRADRLQPGSDLQWLESPWINEEFKDALKKYRHNFNLESYGL